MSPGVILIFWSIAALANPLEPPVPVPLAPVIGTAPPALEPAPATKPMLRPAAGSGATYSGPFESVYQTLLARGAEPEFVLTLSRDPGVQLDEKIVRLNVLNFAKPAHYDHFLVDDSVERCRDFLAKYRKTLRLCEHRYRVPKEVIAALLWVETKHGKNTGGRYVVNTFMNLALANTPEMIAGSMQYLRENVAETDPKFAELKQKVEARSKGKADWAVNELLALGRMRRAYHVDLAQLHGSVSGAFGMAQFIPSSYLELAIDGDGDGRVDLFDARDAICSVGNFLKRKGWGASEGSHEKALYEYNRSSDYGQTILKLADKLRTVPLKKKHRRRPGPSARRAAAG